MRTAFYGGTPVKFRGPLEARVAFWNTLHLLVRTSSRTRFIVNLWTVSAIGYNGSNSDRDSSDRRTVLINAKQLGIQHLSGTHILSVKLRKTDLTQIQENNANSKYFNFISRNEPSFRARTTQYEQVRDKITNVRRKLTKRI